jgi:hypothetical protein
MALGSVRRAPPRPLLLFDARDRSISWEELVRCSFILDF